MKSKVIKLAVASVVSISGLFLSSVASSANAQTKNTQSVLKIDPRNESILAKRLCTLFNREMTIQEIYPVVYRWIGIHDQGIINSVQKSQELLLGSGDNVYTSFVSELLESTTSLTQHNLTEQFINKHAPNCFNTNPSTIIPKQQNNNGRYTPDGYNSNDSGGYNLENNNTLFTLYMNRGYDAVKEKNYDSALILFKQALEKKPNNPYALKAIENTTRYANKRSPWQLIGKTSTEETIFLDISSAHFIGYGEASEFVYKFAGKVTTRINKAITESCNPKTGKIDKNGSPEWLVTNQNGKKVHIVIKADSKASIQMLNRVCYQSKLRLKKR